MKQFRLLALVVTSATLYACGGGSSNFASSSSSSLNNTSSSSSAVSSETTSSSEVISSSETTSSSEAISSSEANSSSEENSSSEVSSSSSSLPSHPDISTDCVILSTDPTVNWRDLPSLQTDQEIVECLSTTLGRAVGYGEKALGGYDPNGNSKLIIINTSDTKSVEQQVKEAITGDEHKWIVFDKVDFADEYEISFHRLWCSDTNMLTAIGGTTAECLDYRLWCSNRGYTNHNTCMEEFFNKRLNSNNLSNVRNPIVGSNTTIDGRLNNAYFRFMGFRVGNDSSGISTATAVSVIITNIDFKGAGHNEDHKLDPDMIRSTGESHDIWIHKNRFDLTGDSAFDVKMGAYNLTVSFNEVIDVKRAALHGAVDSRLINGQITTTIHHNAFYTRDEHYLAFGNTGRRVPLVRRGTSHMFNNVFTNYRKEILSVRLGGSVLFEDNAFVVNEIHQEKSTVEASLNELQGNLIKDVRNDSHMKVADTYLWFAEGSCKLIPETQRNLSKVWGDGVADLSANYTNDSRVMMWANYLPAGQDLVDYVRATAGPDSALPFNSPLAPSVNDVLNGDRCSGAPPGSGGPGVGLPAPDVPSLEVDNFTVGELTLTWPDAERAIGYTLRYGLTDNFEDDLVEVADVTSPYTLSGLDGGTTYYLFLRADGATSNSDWAEAQSTTIDPTQPPAAPAAPRVRGGDQQVTVTWTAVPNTINYELLYNTVDSESGATSFAGNPVVGTTATITGLDNGTTYYVFVRASNANGPGDYSPSASATATEAEPASCYVDDFTGTYAALSTDGFDQVNSFEWSSRAGSAYTAGTLTGVNQRAALGFFTAPGESIALTEVGDRVRLDIDFTFLSSDNENNADRLRIALMQSVANPTASARSYFVPEGSPNTNARPNAGSEWGEDGHQWAQFYKAITGTVGQLASEGGRSVVANHLKLYQRNQSSTAVLGGSSFSAHDLLAQGGGSFTVPAGGFAGQAMNLELTLELTALNGGTGTVNIGYIYRHNGGIISSMTLNNHETNVLSFDAVGLFFRFNPSYAFRRIIVEHLPVGNTESACIL